MLNDFLKRLESLNAATLEPFVRQALGSETAEVTSWKSSALTGGFAADNVGGYGTYRIEGTARVHQATAPWSLVVKTLGKSPKVGSDDPAHLYYWKREILAYQSGLLSKSWGQFSSARCFGVVQYADDEFWIWLEHVVETEGEDWSLEQYGVTAHHLGRFNGEYLGGRPLPQYYWLTEGGIKFWLKVSEPVIDNLPSIVRNATRPHWLTDHEVTRVMNLWANRQHLLATLARLPRTLCHHDAFRRNLFSQQRKTGLAQTVAIDWQFMGTGVVGEDIVLLISASLIFMHVDCRHVKTLDAIVFQGYLEGLREAGCQLDERLVRFGYTASAALYGLVVAGAWLPEMLDAEMSALNERVIGHPMESILAAFAAVQSHLLDLGEEAQQLANTIQ
jgi:hypothetical protein